jgi:hypothetical protein
MKISTAIVATAAWIALPINANAQTIFAAPSGSGLACTSERPCSLIGARDRVRTMNAAMKSDITVSLASGVYRLQNTFVLTPRDSGTNGFDVVYKAGGPGTTVISGGRAVTGWVLGKDGIARARLPKGLRFRQVYVGDIRAVRARTPNTGVSTDLNWNRDEMTVTFGTPVYHMASLDGVELVASRHWQQHRLRLSSVIRDASGKQTVTLDPVQAYVSFNAMGDTIGENQAYYLENAREFLDSPGEWFHERETNTLLYRPLPHQRINDVVVPVLQTLALLQGGPDRPVHNLRFENLSFEHAGWNAPSDEGFVQVQATWRATLDGFGYMPGAVEVRGIGANHIKFTGNKFSHLGADGLSFYKATHDNTIIGNTLSDISGQGIAIDADPSRFDFTGPGSRDFIITDNVVSNVGVDYTGSVGIFAGYVANARIEHNELFDLPYTGISVGWGWTPQDNPSRNNVIRANDIHDVMKDHDDGAAIYLLSKQPGTVISENYIHAIRRAAHVGSYPVAAIYLDNGASQIVVRDNTIVDVPKRFNQNFGNDPARGIYPAQGNSIIENDLIDQKVISDAGPRNKKSLP